MDNYVHHPSTRVLMLSYAVGDEPVQLWQPHLNQRLPADLAVSLTDPNCTKLAWNAPFEINVFRHVLKIDIPNEWWRCVQAQARYLSLPGGLDKVGDILGLAESEAKFGWQGGKTKEGTRLTNMFCFPAHAGGEQTLFGLSTPFFRDWNTDPKDWELFCEYCKRDTLSERILFNKMRSLLLPESEQLVWRLDQKINETGLPVNREFAENMYSLAIKAREKLEVVLKESTKLDNPNSTEQFLEWIKKEGYPFNSLRKEFVVSALNEKPETSQLTELGRKILLIRQESSKNSYKKLEKLRDTVSLDGRLRHQFLFMGAARTGRTSGTGFQWQNMPRPMKEVEKKYNRAIEIINTGDYEAATKEFSSVIGMATSCLRSAFQATEGKKLIICDLGAIETRVGAWIARCEATLDIFRQGRDPYLDFASEMYGIPYDELKRRYDVGDKEAAFMRQMAKPAVLGCIYGLGGGEVKENKYGDTVLTGLRGYSKNIGVEMDEKTARTAVKVFRNKRPKIVQCWADLENAVIEVLEHGGIVPVGPVVFDRKKRSNGQFILRTLLPSGRYLHYINARIEIRILQGKKGEYEKKGIKYDGVGHGIGAIDDKQQWSSAWLYGGKILENDTQAISRDILMYGALQADKVGFNLVGQCHDELVAEQSENSGIGLKELRECMIATPEWAPGLILDAAGFESKIYRKG